ncbi:MAG: pirin family protein [Sandaracinaceae bacterium]|nr:pirin family protein [Sandaracinaceae bacterium]
MAFQIFDLPPLGSVEPFPAFNPFLFCVHHLDHYPPGNNEFGPSRGLEGRKLGSDFEGRDGWRMYHGQKVPGFPRHPHRGFETITIVQQGFVDHSDSLGFAARYGPGDVQWMSAARGVAHAEMFPLLRPDAPNVVELFQIWLNLPKKSKWSKPELKMMWAGSTPRISEGRARIWLISGEWGPHRAPSPPQASWAADPEAEVRIALFELEKNHRIELPRVLDQKTACTLYHFMGDAPLRVIHGGHEPALLYPRQGIHLAGADLFAIESTGKSEALMLQGRPIEEAVVAHGPFVMNTREEILDAFRDYARTGFGSWDWPSFEPVHGRALASFLRYPDGKIEQPNSVI